MIKFEEEIEKAILSLDNDLRYRTDIQGVARAAAEVAKRKIEQAFNDGILLGWDAKENNFRKNLEKYHQWLKENRITE